MVENYNSNEELNIEAKQIYSEVYEILNILGYSFISKLPNSLYNMIKEKRDIYYEPKYNKEKSFSEQSVKKETISILALLHLNYWCENEKEKTDLNNLFKQNEDKYQEELRQKYNPDKIFEIKKQNEMPKNEIHENQIPIEKNEDKNLIVYTDSRLTKIINKIKRIFSHKN